MVLEPIEKEQSRCELSLGTKGSALTVASLLLVLVLPLLVVLWVLLVEGIQEPMKVL
jgi:hypothetical protein